MSDQERKYWEAKRNALLIELGALEDMLGMERTKLPKSAKGKPLSFEAKIADNSKGKKIA
jgi:hypothetical protein